MNNLNDSEPHPHEKQLDADITAKIIVVSDSLSHADSEFRSKHDISSGIAREMLENQGIRVRDPAYVPDDPLLVRFEVLSALQDVDLVVTIGGTGISKRDTTREAIVPLLDKELQGFSSYFWVSSTQKLGKSIPLLSRMLVGIRDDSIILCTPGSKGGTSDALDLLLPQVKHILSLLHS